SRALTGDVKGLRVGLPREYFWSGIDPEVEEAVKKAVRQLESQGAVVTEVSLPQIRHIHGVHVAIVLTEAATYHEPWLRTRADEYGAAVRFGLEWGKLFMGIDYVQAQRVRELIRADFASALTKVDVMAAPTVPAVAPKAGETTVPIKGSPEDILATMIRIT